MSHPHRRTNQSITSPPLPSIRPSRHRDMCTRSHLRYPLSHVSAGSALSPRCERARGRTRPAARGLGDLLTIHIVSSMMAWTMSPPWFVSAVAARSLSTPACDITRSTSSSVLGSPRSASAAPAAAAEVLGARRRRGRRRRRGGEGGVSPPRPSALTKVVASTGAPPRRRRRRFPCSAQAAVGLGGEHLVVERVRLVRRWSMVLRHRG